MGLAAQHLHLSKRVQVLSVPLRTGLGPFPCKTRGSRGAATGENDPSATGVPVLLWGQLMALVLWHC